MSGYRCRHLPRFAVSDVAQPTALIVFGLNISVATLASVAAAQGLMQGSGVAAVSAPCTSFVCASIKYHYPTDHPWAVYRRRDIFCLLNIKKSPQLLPMVNQYPEFF